jgi:hypothetical protein
MEVEVYMIEGAESEISDPEVNAEVQKLIDECGLSGQRGLLGDGGTRFPFPVLTSEEQGVLKTLFPESRPVEKYDADAIPLRVLSMVALCKREKFFDKFEVWYSPAAHVDDPFLIGVKKDPEYTWREMFYKIARWGNSLHSDGELLRMAVAKKADEMKARAIALAQMAELVMKDPEMAARLNFEGKLSLPN